METRCCGGPVVLWGPPGFPLYLFGRCPRCQEQLAAVQEGPIVARPLALVYAPSAELRAYRVYPFDGRLRPGHFPGGPGVWELEDLTTAEREEHREQEVSASQADTVPR